MVVDRLSSLVQLFHAGSAFGEWGLARGGWGGKKPRRALPLPWRYDDPFLTSPQHYCQVHDIVIDYRWRFHRPTWTALGGGHRYADGMGVIIFNGCDEVGKLLDRRGKCPSYQRCASYVNPAHNKNHDKLTRGGRGESGESHGGSRFVFRE